MAVTPANESTTPLTNIRYSAFLGILYVSTPEVETKITEVKLTIGGETVVKRGYTGNSGEAPSAKALALLKDAGITAVKLNGRLSSAKVIAREVNGRQSPYLNVTLRDDDGRYHLSLDLNQPAAQKLARKLANATPGEETALALFATYGQKPGRDRAYAEHNATLKQNGVEVPGISPKDALQPLLDKAKSALVAAGIDVTDKETHNKRRSTVTLEYHIAVMTRVAEMFSAYYIARGTHPDAPATTDVASTTTTAAAPAPAAAASSPAPVAPKPAAPAVMTRPPAREPVYDPFRL